jgi:hypothetical protein
MSPFARARRHSHCLGPGDSDGLLASWNRRRVRSGGNGMSRRVWALSMNGEDTMTDWLHLIQAEYCEMPGLHLTKAEVQRLWNLDAPTCEAILAALETSSFLRRTQTGRYIRTAA